ncbi:MAG TPA: SPFH domain-containing protein [Candidatus Polarisedimenticolaceae bacterium]|nr:SPFH domain-containing protein [Candidatus Polarisedimenticolaceae bacterium]
MNASLWFVLALGAVLLVPPLAAWLVGLRYIPHDKVGIVEKLWSAAGSLTEGKIVALAGEAGYQADILRGGLHAGLYPWQYRVHRQPLVVISEGKLGYVYARDGEPLPPTQTLGRNVPSNSFQDARAFLSAAGQRGRQRAILREGVYAINLALFVVIAEDRVLSGPIREGNGQKYADWQAQLEQLHGFDPVVIGHGGQPAVAPERAPLGGGDTVLAPTDTIGVVTIHDGPPIESGEIIAPEVKAGSDGDHNYFQDPEAFLRVGGRRGKQLQVLTDGTFFLNRWFATVEVRPKTLIPIGYVGVVVSYHGTAGRDLTGTGFRYGEQVEPGQRGVWKKALTPGKYPLNPYAVKAEPVPTINFVLRWITGRVEAHQYDKDLSSIELITADGYEPVLPLSLVLHIDYEKAPSVVQRFGDVKRLISQTLDPILTSYFRDVAQSSSMLDLLTHREEIQRRATAELGRRFQEYDINCIAVLIGRPESKARPEEQGGDAIERLFDQLRLRRLAEEQKATFDKQEEAARRLKELNHAEAAAAKQAELTQTKIEVEIAGNRGEAQLAEAQRLAERDVARASGESRSRELVGRGEAARIAQVGLSEAAVSLQKIRAYGDSRLYALNLAGEQFAHASQPLVPERLLVMGGGGGEGAAGGGGSSNLFGQLLALLLAERGGVGVSEPPAGLAELERLTAELTRRFQEAR